jgi:hypothetical protein
MEAWLKEHHDTHRHKNIPSITDQMIRTQAKQYARELAIPEDKFKASSGWVENFKHRHNIRRGMWCNREASPDPMPVVHQWSPPPGEDEESLRGSMAATVPATSAEACQVAIAASAGGGESVSSGPMGPPPAVSALYATQGPSVLPEAWPPPGEEVFDLHSMPATQSLDSQMGVADVASSGSSPGSGTPDQAQSRGIQAPAAAAASTHFNSDGSLFDSRLGLGLGTYMPSTVIIHHHHHNTPPTPGQAPFFPSNPGADGAPNAGGLMKAPADLAQAERAMESLLQFFDAQPEGEIISTEERAKLDQIRSKLYAKATALPLGRDERRRTTV